jgi:DNA-binding GntR family transcriptional regulator
MDYDMRNMVKGHQQILQAMREKDLETALSHLESHICMSRDRLLKRMQEKKD